MESQAQAGTEQQQAGTDVAAGLDERFEAVKAGLVTAAKSFLSAQNDTTKATLAYLVQVIIYCFGRVTDADTARAGDKLGQDVKAIRAHFVGLLAEEGERIGQPLPKSDKGNVLLQGTASTRVSQVGTVVTSKSVPYAKLLAAAGMSVGTDGKPYVTGEGSISDFLACYKLHTDADAARKKKNAKMGVSVTGYDPERVAELPRMLYESLAAAKFSDEQKADFRRGIVNLLHTALADLAGDDVGAGSPPITKTA